MRWSETGRGKRAPSARKPRAGDRSTCAREEGRRAAAASREAKLNCNPFVYRSNRNVEEAVRVAIASEAELDFADPVAFLACPSNTLADLSACPRRLYGQTLGWHRAT